LVVPILFIPAFLFAPILFRPV